MIDIGIDWHAVVRQERVSRLAAAPYFEEAGSLLMSAALLWPGRVRGKEAASLGARLADSGQQWRKNALGWADAAIIRRNRNEAPIRVEDAVGPLLADFTDKRGHRPKEPETVPKHEQAARKLVSCALGLLSEGIPLVRRTGDHLYRDKQADDLEDALEIFRESPMAVADPVDVPAVAALRNRAYLRAGEGLCHTVASIYLAGHYADKDAEREKSAWYDRSESFRSHGREAYARMIDFVSADMDERNALLSAMDDASSYCPCFNERHYERVASSRKAGVIAGALIEVLRRLLTENDADKLFLSEK